MNLSQLTLTDETQAAIQGRIDAMTPGEIRDNLVDISGSLAKALFAANYLMNHGDPSGLMIAQAVTAVQHEAERMTDERRLWDSVEQPD